MNGISRREALSALAGMAVSGATLALDPAKLPDVKGERAERVFRIRTLTAGTPIQSFADRGSVEAALDFLVLAKRRFVDAGYAVETIRIALNPLLIVAAPSARLDALPYIVSLDRLCSDHGALLSIGPVFGYDSFDDEISGWAAQLVRATRVTSFSGSVASAAHGVHRAAIVMAASVVSSLTSVLPDGLANFRFAAAAMVPAGTPFFPVGYHEGPASLAVGIESANLVRQAFTGGGSPDLASERLRHLLNREFAPVQALARALALQGERQYLGIDSSIAPGRDSSIGLALETLTGRPFGAASTLQACAAVTGALKSLDVIACGYCGLMLPILEDPVLAARAAEGQLSIADLLLYSTVCGTGLDLVPIPGAVDEALLTGVIGDVATLAVRLRKPLSARLYPVPNKKIGDHIEFSDPLLCSSRVMALGR